MTITAEQRIERRKYIGSSDMAALLGLCLNGKGKEYATPYDVWLEKTGRLEPEPDEFNIATAVGNHMESFVLDTAERTLGKIKRNLPMIVAPELYMACNLDGQLEANECPVEAKVSGVTSYLDPEWGAEWTDEVPARYIIQCHHQMILTKTDRAYAPAVLFGRGFHIYVVERNDAICDTITKAAHDFWVKCVKADTPPDNSLPTLEVVRRIKRKPDHIIELPAEVVAAAKEARDLRKQAEEQEETAKRALFAALGDAEGATSSAGSLTYMERKRAGFDVTAFRADYPDLARRYATETKYRFLNLK